MLPIEKNINRNKNTILARGNESKAKVIKEPFFTGRAKL